MGVDKLSNNRTEETKSWEYLKSLGVVTGKLPGYFGTWNLRDVDLSGKDLSGLHLANVDFEGARLEGTYFVGTFLNISKMRNTNLRKANFENASMWRVDLSGSDLTNAVLKNAHLAGALFHRAILRDANMSGADIREADFFEASLINADCSDCDMYGANFTAADLTNADFRKADISQITVDKALTTGLLVEGAKPKKKYVIPGCWQCGQGNSPQWYHYEEDFKKFGFAVDQPVKRCIYCAARISYGDWRVSVVGIDGTEVAKVIKEIQDMKKQEKIVINVSGGQIGSLNLGEILGNIETNLTMLNESGHKRLANALKDLLQQTLSSQDIVDQVKKEITEQVDELSIQAKLPDAQRKKGIIKSICSNLDIVFITLKGFHAIWPATKELLKSFFNVIF